MKFALHRSIIFWAGILVIAFTCWAWMDSCNNSSGIVWRRLSGGSVCRGILISHDPYGISPFRTSRLPGIAYPEGWRRTIPTPFFLRAQTNDGVELIPTLSMKSGMQSLVNQSPPGTWILYLPYWLILLLILPTWAALLSWRARRGKSAAPSELP